VDGFTFATWNVNSINARVPRVLEFLEVHEPDVLCLQETKVAPGAFPVELFEAAGYQVFDHGSGRWTGVALLVRAGHDVRDVVAGLPGEPLPEDARWIEATVGGVRVVSVYVVNGRDVSDPMFQRKLEMMEAMEARCAELAGHSLIVAGDFNIAPEDRDVWDVDAYEGTTHVTVEERARLRRLLDTRLVDAYRHVEPDEQQFTWWDYRGGAFHRGWGLRIDLALVSPDLAGRIRSCGIDRDFRKGAKPSDHAPLLVQFAPSPQVA
jgi:exodeoxyribonuclease III